MNNLDKQHLKFVIKSLQLMRTNEINKSRKLPIGHVNRTLRKNAEELRICIKKLAELTRDEKFIKLVEAGEKRRKPYY